MSDQYSYTTVTAQDLPLLKNWLEQPHVRKWWGDPDEEIADIRTDMDDPLVAQWLVSLGGAPFAYIQDYDVHDWGEEALSHFPPGSRGIDVFIGKEDMTGQGHGSAIVAERARDMIRQGTPDVIIDPAPDNLAAIRAYEKAGFGDGTRVLLEGEPAQLMVYQKK